MTSQSHSSKRLVVVVVVKRMVAIVNELSIVTGHKNWLSQLREDYSG